MSTKETLETTGKLLLGSCWKEFVDALTVDQSMRNTCQRIAISLSVSCIPTGATVLLRRSADLRLRSDIATVYRQARYSSVRSSRNSGIFQLSISFCSSSQHSFGRREPKRWKLDPSTHP